METTGQQILLAARSDKLRTYSIPGGNNTPLPLTHLTAQGAASLAPPFLIQKALPLTNFGGDEKRLIARILGHIFGLGKQLPSVAQKRHSKCVYSQIF